MLNKVAAFLSGKVAIFLRFEAYTIKTLKEELAVKEKRRMKSFLPTLVLACVAPALIGCVSPAAAPAASRSMMLSEAELWVSENEEWLAGIAVLEEDLPLPLPRLLEDSVFNRHIANLQAHLSSVQETSRDPSLIEARHAELSATHEELREAYANLMKLAEEGQDRPRPEFAEDRPQS